MPECDMMTTEHAAAPLAWPVIGTEPFLRAPFEIGLAMHRYWLVAASRLLQDQAAHLQNLAECSDPLSMLVCQTELAEKSVAAGLEDLRRGVDTVTEAAGEPPQ
ncbi:phasin family protein [Shinella fusca]|uniref:Phasin domain-containing protein n=1 Tax=Shinella fusca TaxID=544480 RepID=A0A7W7YSJ3_9HYPH|nr:phasin family protein [Shinella fusca]MBB5041482.1 hypothetical protein [Shinella fusca]